MGTIRAYTVNAFAKGTSGGNPAGVVPDADGMPAQQMQAIARTIGFSETAFVMKSGVADFRAQFFTPTSEIDFCGHAAIALFYVLAQLDRVIPGEFTLETRAAVSRVRVADDLSVLVDQALPGFFCELDPVPIAAALRLDVSDLAADSPVQIVCTGVRDILVPVKSLKILREMRPDFERVAAISQQHDVVGFHIFTRETFGQATAHCRNLAPLYGIPEESATGSSNGALASYLFKHGLINPTSATQLVMEQGYFLGLHSEILVSLATDGDAISRVSVGGRMQNFAAREVFV